MATTTYIINNQTNKRRPVIPRLKAFHLVFHNKQADDFDLTLRAGLDDNKVAVLQFTRCQLFQIPAIASLHESFPNLTVLDVYNSKLAVIDKSHLQPYPFLKELYLEYNEIRFLPSDLFEYTPDLQIISFCRNPISKVGRNILAPLKDLLYFNLSENYKVDLLYDRINKLGNVIYTELELKLTKEFDDSLLQIFIDLNQEWDEETREWAKKVVLLEKKLERIKQESVEESLASMKKIELLERELDSKNARLEPTDDFAKDFIIKVGDKNFNVHKAIISVYSPVLAKLIAESDIGGVDLKGIEESTFQAILNHMYYGTLPDDVNVIDLFLACGDLQIESLSKFVINKLKDHITSENAIEILATCEYYLNDEVKLLALDKIKENLDTSVQSLSLDRIAEPGMLKTLDKVKKELDAIINFKLFQINGRH